MDRYLAIGILGLGAGALYAALAQGLVLTYKGAGVVNFAVGAIAAYVAYVYSELRISGRYVVPPLPNPLSIIEGAAQWIGFEVHLPDIPTFVGLSGAMSFWPALVIAIVTAGALGALMHLMVFKFLRASPPLARVAASIGVMLALEATIAVRFGPDARSGGAIFPKGSFGIGRQRIPVDRLLLALVAAILTVLLTLLFRRTRLGWATQAAAESERGAIVTGLRPGRLACTNWIISTMAVGVMGVLFSSTTPMTPTNFTLFALPALAVALMASFSSFWVALLSGFGLGVLTQILQVVPVDLGWTPPAGFSDGIPLFVILIVMIVRSKSLPTRGEQIEQELPAAPEPGKQRRGSYVLLAITLAGALWLPFAYRSSLINSMIGVVVAVSLVITVGWLGQISLMQMALAGASALAMTRLAGSWGIPFPIAPLLAAIVASLFGLVVGLPALRIRGTQLAIITLAAAIAFEHMVLRNRSILADEAATGLVPPPSFAGYGFGSNDEFFIGADGIPNPGFAVFTVLVAFLVCKLGSNIRRGSSGRVFLAVRSNERSAAAAGINVQRAKVLGFLLSGFIAGLAGALSAYSFQGTSAETFTALASVTVLAFAYLGGITSIPGAIVAGLLFTGGLASQLSQDVIHAPRYEVLLAGIGLAVMSVVHPAGIVGPLRRRPKNVAVVESAERLPTPTPSAHEATHVHP